MFCQHDLQYDVFLDEQDGHLLCRLFLKSEKAFEEGKDDCKFANFAIANLMKKKMIGNLQILQLQI